MFYLGCFSLCIVVCLLLYPVKSISTFKQGLFFILFAILLSVVTFALYGQWGNPQAIIDSHQKQIAEELERSQRLRPLLAKFKHKTAALEAQLQMNMAQPAKWWELSQIYQLQGREQDALYALREAFKQTPENENLALEYANLIAKAEDGLLTLEAYQIVQKALTQDNKRPLALNLLAMHAYQQGEYKKAITLWEEVVILLQTNEYDKADIVKVKNTIAEVTPKVEAIISPQITVEVSLAQELESEVRPDDVVFIYAKNPQAPQPLAVVRRRVFELPVSVQLGPQHAMLQSWSLHHVKGASFEARVAKAGTAAPTMGDLVGVVSYDDAINADQLSQKKLTKKIIINNVLCS